MNLNNSKYNYARKFKAILKYVLFAVPLIMVLVAVLFPIKTTTNTYNGSTNEVTDTTSSIYFNQLIQNGNFETNSIWKTETGNTLTYNDNSVTIDNTTGASLYSLYPTINYSYIAYHKYLTIVDVKSSNTEQSVRLSHVLNATEPYSRSSDWVTMTYLSYRTSDFIGPYPRIIVQNATANESFSVRNLMMFDLTLMYGVGNEPTASDFLSLFPLDYYDYNSGELLLVHEVNTITTINDTDLIWYTTDSKQLNTSLLTPMTEFYGASINSWYESFLTAFELNYDITSYMYYFVHMPLWIMYVVLLDLLLDIVLLVPCLLHRLVYKYKGDE